MRKFHRVWQKQQLVPKLLDHFNIAILLHHLVIFFLQRASIYLLFHQFFQTQIRGHSGFLFKGFCSLYYFELRLPAITKLIPTSRSTLILVYALVVADRSLQERWQGSFMNFRESVWAWVIGSPVIGFICSWRIIIFGDVAHGSIVHFTNFDPLKDVLWTWLMHLFY